MSAGSDCASKQPELQSVYARAVQIGVIAGPGTIHLRPAVFAHPANQISIGVEHAQRWNGCRLKPLLAACFTQQRFRRKCARCLIALVLQLRQRHTELRLGTQSATLQLYELNRSGRTHRALEFSYPILQYPCC